MEPGFTPAENFKEGLEKCFDEFSDILSKISENSNLSIPPETVEDVFFDEKCQNLSPDHDMRPGTPFPRPPGQEKRKFAHIGESTDGPPPWG